MLGTRRLVLLAALVVVAGCDPSGNVPAEPPPGTVIIRDFGFHPQEIRIRAGETVTWSNQEVGAAHTVTAVDGTWGSRVLQPGDFYRRAFSRPGTHRYACTIHPAETGTVVVEP